MAKKITATFYKVKQMLEADVKYRDNDEKLVVKYWWNEMEVMGIDGNAISAKDFFLMRWGKKVIIFSILL